MSYNSKTNWQLNEIVMPADMNRIEQGIADLDSQLGDKANLSDIPTSLPANGGNADTVGNKGLAELMNYGFNYTDRLRIETGDLNNYTSGGRFMVITTVAAGAITHSPWTNTGYFLDVYRRADSYVIQIAMNWIGEILIRYIAGNNWSEWVNLKDGGNADTLDGFHETSFPRNREDISDCNNAILPGTYNATPATINTPYSMYWFVTVEIASSGKWIRQTATISDRTKPNEIYCRLFINDKWSDSWIKVKDGGNADTLDGLHATAFYPAKGANTAGIDYDTLINTGLFEVNGTSTEPTTHSPNGNDSDNNFYVIVYRHSSSQCTQIAISAREDRSVYIRARANSTWGTWTSFFISNKPHITSVTSTESTIHLKWLPVANATKYAVSKYNGTGTSYTVLSNNITDTEYTITGLTAGTEYNILVQAYINDAWTGFTAADNIIARTNALSSGTATANTTNCPSGAWYGKHS